MIQLNKKEHGALLPSEIQDLTQHEEQLLEFIEDNGLAPQKAMHMLMSCLENRDKKKKKNNLNRKCRRLRHELKDYQDIYGETVRLLTQYVAKVNNDPVYNDLVNETHKLLDAPLSR